MVGTPRQSNPLTISPETTEKGKQGFTGPLRSSVGSTLEKLSGLWGTSLHITVEGLTEESLALEYGLSQQKSE